MNFDNLTPITGEKRDALILQILKRIDEDTQVIAAPERKGVWEKGWQEIRDKYLETCSEDALIPPYIRPGNPVRWKQGFWMPEDPDFELNFVRGLQKNVIAPAMSECHVVYEFGCGTSFNLVALRNLMLDKLYFGTDFVDSSVQLCRDLGFQSYLFDMAQPVGSTFIRDSSAFTMGSIEQLRGKFQNFIEWLIDQKPRIVLHIEPILELYDPNNLVDYLAIMFHRKRGYTEGFLPYLLGHPKVEVLEVRRTFFGSLMMEGYCVIKWRPK